MSQSQVAVLFKSTIRTGFPYYFDNDNTSTFYMLSLRDYSCGNSSGVPHFTSVPDYEQIPLKSWANIVPSNLSGSVSCITSDAELFTTLFFPFDDQEIELCMFKHFVGPRHLRRATEMGISYESVDYLSYSPSNHKSLILRFKSPKQFGAFFWPNHIGLALYSLSFGMQNKLDGELDRRTRPGDDAFAEGTTSTPMFEYLHKHQHLHTSWRYVVKSDTAFHDTSDLLYSVVRSHSVEFESTIIRVLSSKGYNLYILPLRESIISNWLGYGDIPIPELNLSHPDIW